MAETVTTIITKIDNNGTTINNPIIVKQYDTASRFILFKFQNQDGQPYNLKDHEVTFWAERPDGSPIFNDMPITITTNGEAKLELTTELLSIVGMIECEIAIYGWDKSQVLSTLSFWIQVEKSIKNRKAVEGNNTFGVLERLMQQMWELWSFWRYIDDKIGFWIDSDGEKTTLFKYLRSIYNYLTIQITNKLNEIKDFLVNFKLELFAKVQDFYDNLYGKLLEHMSYWTKARAENIDNLSYDLLQLKEDLSSLESNVESIKRNTASIGGSNTVHRFAASDNGYRGGPNPEIIVEGSGTLNVVQVSGYGGQIIIIIDGHASPELEASPGDGTVTFYLFARYSTSLHVEVYSNDMTGAYFALTYTKNV